VEPGRYAIAPLFIEKVAAGGEKEPRAGKNGTGNPKTRGDCALRSLVCQEKYIQLVGVRFLPGKCEQQRKKQPSEPAPRTCCEKLL
jgi:hypothetical protein